MQGFSYLSKSGFGAVSFGKFSPQIFKNSKLGNFKSDIHEIFTKIKQKIRNWEIYSGTFVSIWEKSGADYRPQTCLRKISGMLIGGCILTA